MAGSRRLRLGVLISGNGSNLQSIIDASLGRVLDAEVAVVISSREEAHGLMRARVAGIDAVWVDRKKHTTVESYDRAVLGQLRSHEVDLVVMAGYMRLLGAEVLQAYPHRVVNIHPALLPAFPGAAGIRDAYDYGVKVTGVTVHFADEEFDKGPVIAQEPVRISEGDTLETLESKIHEVEHRMYPSVLQLIAEGRVRIEDRVVHVEPKAVPK